MTMEHLHPYESPRDLDLLENEDTKDSPDKGENFLVSRLKGAFQGFVNWMFTKFIEDDERWEEISKVLIDQGIRYLKEWVPDLIDGLRDAVSVAMTGDNLFVDQTKMENEKHG